MEETSVGVPPESQPPISIDSDQLQVFESRQKLDTPVEAPAPRKQGWGEAGPGRPKGSISKQVKAQREFAERVLGAPGTPEFDEFVKTTRQRLLDGTLSPAIATLILHYAYGKPKETIDLRAEFDVVKIVRVVIDPRDTEAINGEVVR